MKQSHFSIVLTCAALAARAAFAQGAPGAGAQQQQIDTALEEYADSKTPAQRAVAADFLQHLKNRQGVAAAVIAHIEQSRTGTEATLYNSLIEVLKPESCTELVQQLGKTQEADAKGKLIIALRRCQGDEPLKALTAALDDKRPVRFEAHSKTPRRVCDLAYDELFLKLRSVPKFGLDTSASMKGIIRENTPGKQRDALIQKMAANLTPKPPAPASASPTPKPSPSASPASSPHSAPPAAVKASPQPSAPPTPKSSH